MVDKKNQLSNASSTGGLGVHFENKVQASFVILMLSKGFAPCLPAWPIRGIQVQGRYLGYSTDDVIVFVKRDDNSAKLLGQIKHTIKITSKNKYFRDVVRSAWNDFNNKKLFNERTDIIALICGPLSAIDTNDVRNLLGYAEHAKSSKDFFQKMNLANFTSNSQRKKLEVFKDCLKEANDGVELTDEELWRFLKVFRLLIYDLDIKGVTLSLLHSIIGQYSQVSINSLWAELKDVIEVKNENAGSITLDTIPDHIRDVFRREPETVIPKDLAVAVSGEGDSDWDSGSIALDLAVANLVGGWNDKSDGDKEYIAKVSGENFGSWIGKMQNVLHQRNSPLSLKNGIWGVRFRLELWKRLGGRIFDDALDVFKEEVVKVFCERDPGFELEPDQRYAASIYGKVMSHSPFLRKGLADSLALFGNHPGCLSNCSRGKSQAVAVLSIREIFRDADWVLWGSLNDVLPVLAEASPEEFLSVVESALALDPCPFDTLFAQEGNGVMDRNYMTGLLWALEGLAWDEQYLTRVCVVLGELASHDPGGTWANRPANSLSTIFLPWLPQTIAGSKKRQVAVKTLIKENVDVGWRLLMSLLPNNHQISSGTHKPRWREVIPSDWSKKVSVKEYREQVSAYISMAVDIAQKDFKKLNELISYLDHLTPESFNKMLEHLTSKDVLDKPERELLPIWESLTDLISRHKKYSDAEWAMNPELVSKVEGVAKQLAPKAPANLYRRLFSGRDFDLYEEKGDYQEQQNKLGELRQRGVKEIIESGGIDEVVSFCEDVESPYNVGFSLGSLKGAVDSRILPDLLDTENKSLSAFVGGFVWARFRTHGWGWVDSFRIDMWRHSEVALFLCYLPFTRETWDKVSLLLDDESEYWSKVYVDPYRVKGDIDFAVEKLIKFGRPNSAIYCLNRNLQMKQPFNTSLATQALLSAVSTKETGHVVRTHDMVELIKVLQSDPGTDKDELFKVEWTYVPLLDGHNGVFPKILQERICSDTKFFCELIRLIYKSDKSDKVSSKSSEKQKIIATNAYRLLDEWRTVPGVLPDGTFSEVYFKQWLRSVKDDCLKSSHFDVALSTIGQVLIHAPTDKSGFWINKAVAEELNAKDAEPMRQGYSIGVYNSRGVHCVDPSGDPELKLSEKYNKLAEKTENEGFHRFAIALRGLAESYSNDAKRIKDEHAQREHKDQ
jgi:hypothetical protein